MLVFPNAKINIGLNIVSKREDGFHNIETIFYPVKRLTDALEFIPSRGNSFSLSGIKIEGNPSENLVLQAYSRLKEKFDLPDLSIHLHKYIPTGAGLGGGSADASFMLKALQQYFKLPLGIDELMGEASRLGSDCPFYISNEVSSATGRGEILRPVSIDLEGKTLVIIKPPFSVNTKEAYSEIIPATPLENLTDLIKMPVKQWKDKIKNDFEPTVFQKFPELRLIKQSLYDLGALYASLSGSGSAIYAIFNTNPDIPKLSDSYFCWTSKITNFK
jgi:4-diphosphocytidyl-2-C-methyl-D-erythritol kinase